MCALPLLVLVACAWSVRAEASCASCERVHEEEGGGELLEAVKRHILARLQLRARPNITHAHSLPRAAMLPALRRLHVPAVWQDGRVQLPPEPRVEDTSEIISFAETDEMVTSPSGLFFHVSNEGNQTLFVSQASLWLYFKLRPLPSSRPSPRPPRRVRLQLYHQGAGFDAEWRLTEKGVELKRSGWYSFDLTGALRRLLQSRDRRLNMDIRCDDCDQERVDTVLHDTPHRPFVAVRARRADQRGRSKRGLECDGEGGGVCCRRQFYVDFRLIGWSDWIIAPSGYYANYCEGRCPGHMGVAMAVSSFHTAVLNQYRLRGHAPTSTSPTSCCVPTRLGAMSMLYFDDQYNIVKRDVPSMIVEECGCA